MARQRHRKNSSTKTPRGSRGFSFPRSSVSDDVDEKIERARRRRDAERRSESSVERAAPKRTRDDFRRHGYPTTKGGVLADGPRDARGNPLPGARTELYRGGIVKQSIDQRRDFIVGFTPAEKRQFAKNPDAFVAAKLAELEARFPLLRNRRHRQVRLQWGAYRATKDFSPTAFDRRYFEGFFEHIKGKPRKKRIDALTGLHIVVHVPKSSTADKQKRKRRASKKGRKKK